jgi:hypothetical protein
VGAPGRDRPGRHTRRQPPDRTEGPNAAAFAALFAGGALAVERVADFASVAWRKLCLNAASGALTALTARTVEVLHEPGMAELARGIILECCAVARAEGVALPDSVADEVLARLLATPAGSGNRSFTIAGPARSARRAQRRDRWLRADTGCDSSERRRVRCSPRRRDEVTDLKPQLRTTNLELDPLPQYRLQLAFRFGLLRRHPPKPRFT